jgi:hypothetical protein
VANVNDSDSNGPWRVIRGGRRRRKTAIFRRQSIGHDWPAEIRQAADELNEIALAVRGLAERRNQARERLNRVFDAAGLPFAIRPGSYLSGSAQRMAEYATRLAAQLEKVATRLRVVDEGCTPLCAIDGYVAGLADTSE